MGHKGSTAARAALLLSAIVLQLLAALILRESSQQLMASLSLIQPASSDARPAEEARSTVGLERASAEDYDSTGQVAAGVSGVGQTDEAGMQAKRFPSLDLPLDSSAKAVGEQLLSEAFRYKKANLIITAMSANATLHSLGGLRSIRNFPSRLPPYLRGSSGERFFETCAVVGNSGTLLGERFGHEINGYDAVMRINQAPTRNYEKNVGSKTTFRLLNQKWGSQYTSKATGQAFLLDQDPSKTTLLLSRTSPQQFEHLMAVLRKQRPDNLAYMISEGVISRARWMLHAYRDFDARRTLTAARTNGLDIASEDNLERGASTTLVPSSGFVGLYFLLQVCEKVTTYGFSGATFVNNSSRVNGYKYHYFTNFHDSAALRTHPHHSFKIEVEVVRSLVSTGIVRIRENSPVKHSKHG